MAKKIILVAAALLVIYVGVYVVLSAAGGYHLGHSGKVRWDWGLSFPDLEIFHPKWALYQPGVIEVRGDEVTYANLPGYVFSPMIILDRKFIHKTVVLIEPSVLAVDKESSASQEVADEQRP